jgi:hypothetical protein
MMMEGLQGRAAEEVTSLFRLQAKEARQQLRRGFKTIFDTFGVRLAGNRYRNNTISYYVYACHCNRWQDPTGKYIGLLSGHCITS